MMTGGKGKEVQRRALEALRSSARRSMLGDALPEDQRPSLVITIGGPEPGRGDGLMRPEEDDEDEEY